MANKKDTQREELLDQAERFWIMGMRKPYQLMQLLCIDNWQTANEYLRIAARRAVRHHINIDKEKIFHEQVTLYSQMIIELWACYGRAEVEKNTNACIGAINALTKVLQSRHELFELQFPIQQKVYESTYNSDSYSLYEILKMLPVDEAQQIIIKINEAGALLKKSQGGYNH